MEEIYSMFRDVGRTNIHELWEMGKEGITPDGEDGRLLKILKEHKEYHKVWEMADDLGDTEYTVDGVNPFLHVMTHLTIENQLAQNTPKIVRKILSQLQSAGISHHEAIHIIGKALMECIFNILKYQVPFNEQEYIKKLKKIVKQHT